MGQAWRLLPAALLVLLTATTVTAAAGDLAVDAGSSREAVADPVVPVDGTLFGASADDVDIDWSFTGGNDSARFGNASALDTTFNASGLPAGDVTLNLTATDPGTGETASDTVVYAVAPAQTLRDLTDQVGPGLPDEIVDRSGADTQTKRYNFTVPDGTDAIVATLDWTNQDSPPFFDNDFDLRLLDPAGEDATGSQGASLSQPERVRVSDPVNGTWTAQVEPWLANRDTVHLQIRTDPDTGLPDARVRGPLDFGQEDTQEILATASSPSGFADTSWDLDDDGTYETNASLRPDGLWNVTADFTQGSSDVAFHGVTPDHGYEVRDVAEVTVHGVDTAVNFGCGGKAWRPQWSMEYNLSRGSCWMHGGKHTYYLGQAYTLEGGWGRVFSVEQQLSPPREADAETSTAVDTTDPTSTRVGADVDAPVRIEVSADGQDWTTVGVASYDVTSTSVSPQRLALGFDTRQTVAFTLSGHDEPFRYLRIHEPRSSAEGLSGFLDRSKGILLLDAAAPEPETDPSPIDEVTYDCLLGDHLEDFFPAHPCTYGGANRYDAPSFSHTYPLDGVGIVESIDVGATVAPWRSDDYFLPFVPPLGDVTGTTLHVETSLDGRSWTTHAIENVTYGVSTGVTVDVGDEPARFVRLHTGYHRLYDQAGTYPSLHHPDGYLVESFITVR